MATLSRDAAKVNKLLQARDPDSIRQALALARDLPGVADELCDEVSLDEQGRLLGGKRFTGTKATQGWYDWALVGMLSLASTNSKAAAVRSMVKTLVLNLHDMPVLRGFNGLESLKIRLSGDLVIQSLDVWGELPLLQQLALLKDADKPGIPVVRSLGGIKAPKLKTLLVGEMGLEAIDDLAHCPELEAVCLEGNPVESIEGIAGSLSTLKYLNIARTRLKDVKILEHAMQLESFSIEDIVTLDSLSGLAGKKWKKAPSWLLASDEWFEWAPSYTYTALGNIGKCLLKTLDDMPDVENVIIDSEKLEDISGIINAPSLLSVQISSPALVDVSILEKLKNVTGVKLHCKNVTIGPAKWPNTLSFIDISATSLISTGIFTHTGATSLQIGSGIRKIGPSFTNNAIRVYVRLPPVATEFPADLADVIAESGVGSLSIGSSDIKNSLEICDLSVLERCINLLHLDLSAIDRLNDINFILNLGRLNFITISCACPAKQKLGNAIWPNGSTNEIANLKMRIRGEKKPRKPIKLLAGGAKEIWKLLNTEDIDSIRKGLALAEDCPDEVNALLEGIDLAGDKGVFTSSEKVLVINKKFKSSKIGKKYLNAALYGLLARTIHERNDSRINVGPHSPL